MVKVIQVYSCSNSTDKGRCPFCHTTLGATEGRIGEGPFCNLIRVKDTEEYASLQKGLSNKIGSYSVPDAKLKDEYLEGNYEIKVAYNAGERHNECPLNKAPIRVSLTEGDVVVKSCGKTNRHDINKGLCPFCVDYLSAYKGDRCRGYWCLQHDYNMGQVLEDGVRPDRCPLNQGDILVGKARDT